MQGGESAASQIENFGHISPKANPQKMIWCHNNQLNQVELSSLKLHQKVTCHDAEIPLALQLRLLQMKSFKKGLKNMESTLFLASSTFPDSQVSQWVSRHESTLCSVGLQLPGEQDQGRLKVFLDGVQRVNVVKDMWFFAF